MRSDNSCTCAGISHAAKALSGANVAAKTRERERERESTNAIENRFITSIALSYHHSPPLKRRGGELSTPRLARCKPVHRFTPSKSRGGQLTPTAPEGGAGWDNEGNIMKRFSATLLLSLSLSLSDRPRYLRRIEL